MTGIGIAVSLMPPLVATGIGIADGETAFAWGMFRLFLLNVIGIWGASAGVFFLFGMKREYAERNLEEKSLPLEDLRNKRA